MKTLTEFSGTLLRAAAELRRKHREAHPSEAEPAADAPAAERQAVGEAMKIDGDRLSRLMEALEVVGESIAGVRLLRVLSGEQPPPGGVKIGDFYFVVDLIPAAPARRESRPPDAGRRRERDRRSGERAGPPPKAEAGRGRRPHGGPSPESRPAGQPPGQRRWSRPRPEGSTPPGGSRAQRAAPRWTGRRRGGWDEPPPVEAAAATAGQAGEAEQTVPADRSKDETS